MSNYSSKAFLLSFQMQLKIVIMPLLDQMNNIRCRLGREKKAIKEKVDLVFC